MIDEAVRQIDGQRASLPAEAVVTIEDWTEYGLSVPIHMAHHGAQDPKVVATKGDRSWQEYTSERKAHYERQKFPTDHPDARVVVRKVNDASRWLVGAWAADGVARTVVAQVPDLGDYRIPARPEGALHPVERKGDKLFIRWLDEAGMTPSLTASGLRLETF